MRWAEKYGSRAPVLRAYLTAGLCQADAARAAGVSRQYANIVAGELRAAGQDVTDGRFMDTAAQTVRNIAERRRVGRACLMAQCKALSALGLNGRQVAELLDVNRARVAKLIARPLKLAQPHGVAPAQIGERSAGLSVGDGGLEVVG